VQGRRVREGTGRGRKERDGDGVEERGGKLEQNCRLAKAGPGVF